MRATTACSVLAVLLAASLAEAKRQLSEKEMFGSKSLRCLVCKALVEEFEWEVDSVDPKKKINVGSFRLSADGNMERKVITYARSETHLNEVVDKICVTFDEYAQAKEKSTGEPTVIRIMTHEGGMNPRFSEIDIVPDEDLNKRLRFYCESIVELHEDVLLELFATKRDRKEMVNSLCFERTGICEKPKNQEL